MTASEAPSWDLLAPDPLTPSDCDLRGFPFMPLDVVRLRDSEAAAADDAEAFRAAMMLWCAAWHQVPAGSLPSGDAALCRLAGYGRDRKTWRRAKEGGALRGFVLCSDNRLYHVTVAEKAREAWERKCGFRARTDAARRARAANRAPTRDHFEGDGAPSPPYARSSVTDDVTDRAQSMSDVCNKLDRDRDKEKEEVIVPLALLTGHDEDRDQGRAATRPQPRPARAKARTQISPNWAPSESGRAYAAERGVHLSQVEAFRNHHVAKGSTMADWDAAWRTWCGNAVEFGRAPGRPVKPSSGLGFTAMSGGL